MYAHTNTCKGKSNIIFKKVNLWIVRSCLVSFFFSISSGFSQCMTFIIRIKTLFRKAKEKKKTYFLTVSRRRLSQYMSQNMATPPPRALSTRPCDSHVLNHVLLPLGHEAIFHSPLILLAAAFV